MTTYLITGANRGVGAALDVELTARGNTVLGTARNHPEFLPLDVTDPAQHRALAIRLEGQAIDTLVCNAGVLLDRGHNIADGFGAEIWADTFAVNVTGVFLSVQALLPNLQLSDAPKIAIIGSQLGSATLARGGTLAYNASKGAVLNLGRALSTELAPLGIAVGVYHPGWVQSDMGGAQADITEQESARGLADRFEALSMQSTGCFETWDGKPHAF